VGGGAPISISGLMQQNAWSMTRLYDANLTSVLTETDVNVLHAAVLARCDGDDGVKDGLVGNPAACKVNVDELVCRSVKRAECLSAGVRWGGSERHRLPELSRRMGGARPGAGLDVGPTPG
jgi:feruloyl esterase